MAPFCYLWTSNWFNEKFGTKPCCLRLLLNLTPIPTSLTQQKCQSFKRHDIGCTYTFWHFPTLPAKYIINTFGNWILKMYLTKANFYVNPLKLSPLLIIYEWHCQAPKASIPTCIKLDENVSIMSFGQNLDTPLIMSGFFLALNVVWTFYFIFAVATHTKKW